MSRYFYTEQSLIGGITEEILLKPCGIVTHTTLEVVKEKRKEQKKI